MIIGNAGIVTVMSSLILTFVLPDTLSSKLYGLLVVVIGMLILWWAVHSDVVDRALSKVINKMLTRYTDLEIQDYAAVLHLKDSYKISEKKIDETDWMCNQTLQQLKLRQEGITILGVERKDEPYFGSPSGSFELLPNDNVTVYGKANAIKSVFQRKRDSRANQEHKENVHKEDKRTKEQDEKKKNSTT